MSENAKKPCICLITSFYIQQIASLRLDLPLYRLPSRARYRGMMPSIHPSILTLNPPTRQQLHSLDALQSPTNHLLPSLCLGQDHFLHLDQIQRALHRSHDAFVVGGRLAVRGSRGAWSWKIIVALASCRRISTRILARRCGIPGPTRLFFQRVGDVHELLESLGLLVDGNTVVDFQHLDNARKLRDDFVLDLHLCRTV